MNYDEVAALTLSGIHFPVIADKIYQRVDFDMAGGGYIFGKVYYDKEGCAQSYKVYAQGQKREFVDLRFGLKVRGIECEIFKDGPMRDALEILARVLDRKFPETEVVISHYSAPNRGIFGTWPQLSYSEAKTREYESAQIDW